MTLTFDAARGRGLELESRLGNGAPAPLTNPVRAFAQPLEGSLDLLAVLVEKVDQDVSRLAIRQRLGQVGVLGNPCDHPPQLVA